MPKGRTPKTVEEHKKAGTYRKDRHAARAVGEAEGAVGIYGITFTLGGVSIYFSKNGVKFSYTEVYE